MAPKCKCCHHKQRKEIDAALLSGISNRTIATQYEVSISSVQRHRSHIPAALAKAKEVREITRSDDLLQQTQDLLVQARGITNSAQGVGDLKTALMGIGQVKGILELLIKINIEMARSAEAQRDVTKEITGPIQFVQISTTRRD